MSGALREILVNHFSDVRNLSSPKLRKVFSAGGYVEENSSGSPPYSPIFIDTLDRWKPTHSEDRPAILLKEGDWTFQTLGTQGLADTDLRTGTKSYIGLWAGSHVAFALATESALAKILATEVAKLLIWQASAIASSLQLLDFRVSKLGATARSRESVTSYVVPIDMGYIAAETWQVSEDAPRVKQIKFRLSSLLRDY